MNEQSGHTTTDRLYYTDAYLTAFRAQVLERNADSCRIVLDRSAFYPTSGGQPHDLGSMNGIRITDVIDEGERIVHVLESTLEAREIEASIDWSRRWDHMQQHTGQHLLSAVLADLFGIQTVSFHMGATSSTIDLATAMLTPEQIETAGRRANAVVQENRPVHITVEDAATATGLRKASERTGAIRIITIESLDRSACGGTHVRFTGEIGAILLRSTDKIRGNVRLEFVCGQRAVHAAHADYNTLDLAARAFSAKPNEVPALVSANLERLKDAEKTRRKLEEELATHRGRALYSDTHPNERGLRVVDRIVPEGPLGDELRSEATAFVAGGNAIYMAVSEAPASVMIMASADVNAHCGNVLKDVLAGFSGRGGGSARVAQGSFAGESRAVLAQLRERLVSV